MPFDTLSPFSSTGVISIIKIVTLAILAIYIIFTFVILVQVRVMNRIFTETFASTVLFFLALGNLIFAFSLFAVALAIL